MSDVESFIKRWTASTGAERANFQSFANELCQVLAVPVPDPSYGEDTARNDYTFERSVRMKDATGSASVGRIDLYKRNAFVMEAKQSREKGRPKASLSQGDLFQVENQAERGKKTAARVWDALMNSAREQAQNYAHALDNDHDSPPFVIVCDVGHCIELYADFSGRGRQYTQFPDPLNYRISIEELRDSGTRSRLATIWTDPHSLDPAKRTAKVTREVASHLATVSRALELRLIDPLPAHEQVAMGESIALFLMRCLFTMFAEDMGLLPKNCFTAWLADAKNKPDKFAAELSQLWIAMDKGNKAPAKGYATIAGGNVRRFNGHFFENPNVFELLPTEIAILQEAASKDWRDVEPAIFGTLLEQALDKTERAKLGAHYTPRAYVERIVSATIIDPLRQEWVQVQATVQRMKDEKRDADAMRLVRDFHHRLCTVRVLDPACGTGNFLYLSFALLKVLEGEVGDAAISLGTQEGFDMLRGERVMPRQFLGIEKNTRAAGIAELVIWIGYLQWHFRMDKAMPEEPILERIDNIKAIDALLSKDGTEQLWDTAEFIVGNPPFIGGKDIRNRLGDAYCEKLWAVHQGRVNESADFVMYWWNRAAEILTAPNSKLERFGFVTTNSITQVFSRRVVESHLASSHPLSIIMAVPDHPWTKATKDHASVRIAMTVAKAGEHMGRVHDVVDASALDTDEPIITTTNKTGRINADLTAGVDVGSAVALAANGGLSSRGMSLHGAGFIVTPEKAAALGLGTVPGLERHIRAYRNGRDLMATPRGVMVVDLFGFEADEVRKRFPHVYQHVLETVKPERDANNRASYRDSWWVFGEPRKDLRPALECLPRYIATVETAKHRVFQFLDAAILPDNKLVCIGFDDAFILGVLSSRVHVTWSIRTGGWLGVGNDSVYIKSRCFDPFPFPDCDDAFKAHIRATAEELDNHRKARQAEKPSLTLTQMYNVLEKLRSGSLLDEEDERIKRDGLVLILRELHDTLDMLVLNAYGWTDQPDDELILQRLVSINAMRSEEEKTGVVKWLRPDYQRPLFGDEIVEQNQLSQVVKAKTKSTTKRSYPTNDDLAETVEVMQALLAAKHPITVGDLSATFAQGRKVESRVKATIQALSRMGQISETIDGKFSLVRRV